MRIFITIILLSIFSIISTMWLLSNQELASSKQAFSVSKVLSTGDISNFSRADKPRTFSFPEDEGAHPDFQTEWWYYTGNLQTKKGRKLGFQFTIFRRAICLEKPERQSPWSSNQIYFAHFAISDIDNGIFFYDEKFSRGAMNLAGAQINPVRIWIENWYIEHQDNVHIWAGANNHEIDLVVESLKPHILNGDKGLSQKSDEKGNASYYYSLTRLSTKGKIIINNEVHEVEGLSWLDREWSTSVLGKEQAGWDWFSLQLDDEREIMLYQLRKKNGEIDKNSSGTFVFFDGSYEHLKQSDFEIKVLDHWKSPKSNIEYPSYWKVTIAKHNIEIFVKPHQANQELVSKFTYWEGAAEITGKGISGNGYVELTGYQEP